jgi:ABC-type antimicrobial peptide transport system permease subunit
MLGIAGGMALLLGVAGIYGVISYSVSQRTREIGIRIALGPQAQAVTRMFVAHGLTLAGVGMAIGLTAAFGIMRVGCENIITLPERTRESHHQDDRDTRHEPHHAPACPARVLALEVGGTMLGGACGRCSGSRTPRDSAQDVAGSA